MTNPIVAVVAVMAMGLYASQFMRMRRRLGTSRPGAVRAVWVLLVVLVVLTVAVVVLNVLAPT